MRNAGQCENFVGWGDMSSAKDSENDTRSVVAETAASVESGFEKLEPEVARMLVGLVVATGVIGALFLLS